MQVYYYVCMAIRKHLNDTFMKNQLNYDSATTLQNTINYIDYRDTYPIVCCEDNADRYETADYENEHFTDSPLFRLTVLFEFLLIALTITLLFMSGFVFDFY